MGTTWRWLRGAWLRLPGLWAVSRGSRPLPRPHTLVGCEAGGTGEEPTRHADRTKAPRARREPHRPAVIFLPPTSCSSSSGGGGGMCPAGRLCRPCNARRAIPGCSTINRGKHLWGAHVQPSLAPPPPSFSAPLLSSSLTMCKSATKRQSAARWQDPIAAELRENTSPPPKAPGPPCSSNPPPLSIVWLRVAGGRSRTGDSAEPVALQESGSWRGAKCEFLRRKKS